MSLDLSVIIPIFCEEENIPELYRRLTATLEAYLPEAAPPAGDSPLGGSGAAPRTARYEIVFVNDHSLDRSMELLRGLHAADPRVKILSFSRNFGHQIAITAGMQFSSGRLVALMDGDLQDPPEVIPDLLRTKDSGAWDIVYAVRRKRKEPWPVRLLYYTFYRLLKKVSYIDIPMDAGDFCVMSRRVVDRLNDIPERNRFVRGLRSWIGFRQTGMEYERAARHAGSAKYTLKSLMKLAFDGILSFSFLPLRLSSYLGIGISAVAMLYALFIIVERSLGRFANISGWSTIIVSVLALGGVQLIVLGVIGEYLARIYEEIKGRPQFIVDELIGFEADEIVVDAPRRRAPAGS